MGLSCLKGHTLGNAGVNGFKTLFFFIEDAESK
jgi:hypothetical protein